MCFYMLSSDFYTPVSMSQNIKVAMPNVEPTIIDNFIMIYLNAKESGDPNVDLEVPDMYMELNNPNAGIGLIDSKLWFVDDYAIVGIRAGESWDQVDFYELSDTDTKYIKEIVEYEKE